MSTQFLGTVSWANPIVMEEQSVSPTGSAGIGTLYSKTDGILYFRDSSDVEYDLLASTATPPGGADTQIQFNNAGAFGGSAGITWDGTNLISTATRIESTATSGEVFRVRSDVSGTPKIRTTLGLNGHQTWTLFDGAAESGTIGYSTPAGNVGIVFRDDSVVKRSDFAHLKSSTGGGFTWGAHALGTPPANQMTLDGDTGFLGIGPNIPAQVFDINEAVAGNYISRIVNSSTANNALAMHQVISDASALSISSNSVAYTGAYPHGPVKASGTKIGAGSGASSLNIGTAGSAPIHFFTVNATAMSIDALQHVGIGTLTPATSALLELSSTTGAMLLSRMTTAEKTALTGVDGMLVYDSTLGQLHARISGAWADIGSGKVSTTLLDLSVSGTATGLVPNGAVVTGITTRVITAIVGPTGFDVGDGTDIDRWGAAIPITLGTTSDNSNWTVGTVECFPIGNDVVLTAVGAAFTSGSVRVTVHYTTPVA